MKSKKKMNTLIKRVLILFISLFLMNCHPLDSVRSPAAMLSVSSDGRYVISTHYGRFLVLWDIEQRTRKILNQRANIFSSFFIPNSHYFLWQDAKNNDVHMQSVDGRIIRSFNPGFAVYGHVMSANFKDYIASMDNWSLYYLKDGHMKCFKESFDRSSGSARLLFLSIEKQWLLSSGHPYLKNDGYPFKHGHTAREINPYMLKHANYSVLEGLVLWDMNTKQPVMKFLGNTGQTVASLSPDAQYLVSGDESIFAYVWETKHGKRFRLYEPIKFDATCYGQFCRDGLKAAIETNLVIPNDLYSPPQANPHKTVAIKFIDEQGHFIRFTESVHYGMLYHVSSPRVESLMHLGTNPQPDTFSIFDNANIIDTAPQAKILVMGQSARGSGHHSGSGIIVYRFDEKTKQLERLWAPEGPPAHRRIVNPNDPREG